MSMSLEELFKKYPNVEIIEVLGYDDQKPFGQSSDGRKLKLHDENFAGQLASLSGANSSTGHITNEGYCIRGNFNIRESAHNATVHRSAPKQ